MISCYWCQVVKRLEIPLHDYTAQDQPSKQSYVVKMTIEVMIERPYSQSYFPGDYDEESSKVQIELYEKEKH